jgi:Spy/CpxP family protein refolding chaperone
MRGTKKIIGTAIVAVALVGLAGAADAFGGKGRGSGRAEGGPGYRIERMAARLELTDEQKAEIDKIHEEGTADAARLRKELRRAKNELEGVMLDDAPKADEVRKLAREVGDLRTEMQILRLEKRLAFRKVLTPEQLDKWIAHHGGRGMGPGRGRGHGPCGDGDGPGSHREGRGYRHGGHGGGRSR